MEIQEKRQGAVTVIRPQGPLVAEDAEQFRLRLGEVMHRSLGRFVVDLGGVAFVDSLGLEVLKHTTDLLGEGGQSLRVCGTNETVREVLELTDLAESFEYFADVGSAVRSFL